MVRAPLLRVEDAVSRASEVRCAIYTRKSSEEGLDQEFNSLHAQREACAAFIVSQRSVGWRALETVYEDGGVSGGTMERPGLRRLLGDIDAGLIDMIVVYKIDRLTRSLADFSKMIDRFDAAGASFVSVTQAFNTSTSMGRLTLNVLLSFAQFEREVTAERIRDKIAASKKKGIWMGGLPPLGYDARDRSLMINEAEADTVREIFRLYLELGCVRAVKHAADAAGLRSKRRRFASGRASGGGAFSRGALYQILSNPIYVGAIRHAGELHEGRHKPILDREVWERVQTRLAENAARYRDRVESEQRSPMAGKLFDETGDRLTPSHARKGERRYRYYVSRRLTTGTRADDPTARRLPALELERRVSDAVIAHLEGIASPEGASLADHMAIDDAKVALRAGGGSAALAFVSRVSIASGALEIVLDEPALQRSIPDACVRQLALQFTTPFEMRRRGVETKLVIDSRTAEVDNRLVELIGKAQRYWREIRSGAPISKIAARERVTPSWIGQVVQLAFLAPVIVESCLDGEQPPELSAQTLMSGRLPIDWRTQRRQFGFQEPRSPGGEMSGRTSSGGTSSTGSGVVSRV